MRYLFVMSVFLLTCCATAYGETVEEATERYFQVTKNGDFLEASELFDPTELRSFRESLAFLANLPAASRDDLYRGLFGALSTQDTVDQLSDVEFFAAFFGVSMSQSGMTEVMRAAKTEYLGHVFEGDDVAHAVTRVTIQFGATANETLSVASFIRRGESWKMKMSGDVRGVADKIRAAVGM